MRLRQRSTSTGPPAGWYVDPRGGGKRYWDGAQWSTRASSSATSPTLAHPPEGVRVPDSSLDFFALPPAAVAALLLDMYGERGEISMAVAVMNVAQRLDGDEGLTESRRRRLGMMIAEACNLLERVGAVCHRPDSDDHRMLLITNRGHRFWAMDDPAAALSAAAGD